MVECKIILPFVFIFMEIHRKDNFRQMMLANGEVG